MIAFPLLLLAYKLLIVCMAVNTIIKTVILIYIDLFKEIISYRSYTYNRIVLWNTY